jgi:hypothetical protein
MKANPEVIINDILLEMDFSTSRSDVMAITRDKWQMGERTFDRYWALAKKRFLVVQKDIADMQKAVILETAEARMRSSIMSKQERMEVLSAIARSELDLAKEVVTALGIETLNVKPDYNDRKAAIAELNKMEGDYAPVKTDLTSKGEKIQSTPSTIQIEIIKTEDED